MEQRNRGIDLLRMTAMWMVVILHILNKGGVLAAAAPLVCGAGDRTAAGDCRLLRRQLLRTDLRICRRSAALSVQRRAGPVAAGGVLHAGHHGGICMSDARQRQR